MVIPENLERIKEIIAVANTPMYLYRQLRAATPVVGEVNVSEVSSQLGYELKKDLSSLDTMARVFRLVAFLTHFPPDESQPCFERLQKLGVRWAKEMADITAAEFIPTIIVEKNLVQRQVPGPQFDNSPYSTTLIELGV